ncbi:MAG TPA: hypothetical protein VFL17_09805 [Anaerolineae bacterium]|nr:hypothetical protein [Anaerolineae bacterium]
MSIWKGRISALERLAPVIAAVYVSVWLVMSGIEGHFLHGSRER